MSAGSGKPAIVVAGPTCSGKSALAMDLAEQFGGVVINADSMQVYRELRVLTARPSPEDEMRVPHALYGVRAAAEAASVAWWRAAALHAMREAGEAGRIPILCGGTGLYLASLSQGLAEIPDPGDDARTEARALLQALGPAGLHARLAQADPETAARVRPGDSQRLARAWEVWRGTGTGLTGWLALQTPPDDFKWALHAVLLDPPRQDLRHAIALRFDAMVAQGALDEVRALLDRNLDPALPAMRAHGVPELAACLTGAICMAEAKRRACLAMGRYTRRQATWFRHRHIAAPGVTHRLIARYDAVAQYSDSLRMLQDHIICLRS